MLFFTGKGGMGKTTLACATAVTLAASGKRALIVSTDPASNLDEVLQTDLGQTPRPIVDVPGLDALNIDPEAAAAAHRERAVAPFRGVLPDIAIASMQESLSGACTVEIAAFDAFAGLLDTTTTSSYDHVIFDTAPTGHTLRLLSLPGAWTDFIDANITGTSCLGPLAGLQAQRELYGAAVAALGDRSTTTLVLVSRPERSALAEAARASHELRAAGMTSQLLLVNGVLERACSDDAIAAAFAARQGDALAAMPAALGVLARADVALGAQPPIGAAALAGVFTPGTVSAAGASPAPEHVDARPLHVLVDEIEAAGPGVVMAMGKGGVGKTTIAAAIAVELARRGHDTLLSTTDPAAHLLATVDDDVDGLEISRIDPAAATDAYRADVLATAGRGLQASALAVLEEDLRSPCTEEIAVFRAFADAVAQGTERFVILDTAPTGHTLLLLDAAEAYHREIERGQSEVPDPVRRLLPRLRDPAHTRVVIVAVPEPTPVHEARRLAADLQRAGIVPFAWVINQSFAAADTQDPVLQARGRSEQRWIDEALAQSPRAAIVGWQATDPTGAANLALLAT
ncbi:MAG: arsenical pump-driving ATPase [Solirubrobacteraceae bacterium]